MHGRIGLSAGFALMQSVVSALVSVLRTSRRNGTHADSNGGRSAADTVRVKGEALPVNSLLFTGNRVLALVDLYL